MVDSIIEHVSKSLDSSEQSAVNDHYLSNELVELVRADRSILRFIEAAALDGMWFWDLENPDHEWMSDSFWTTLGYDPNTKKHLAAEWQDIIFQDDLETALDNFQKHAADPDHPYDQIVRYRHADGSTVWVRCRGMAVRNQDGEPIRMLGAHTDITQLKLAEEALSKQKIELEVANAELLEAQRHANSMVEFQTLVQETIPGFVFVKDADFKIVMANERFLKLYPESKRANVIGYTTFEDYRAEEMAEFLEKDKEAFEQGRSEVTEKIAFPNGEIRSLHTVKTHFKDESGADYILGIASDVSEREILIAELERSNADLKNFTSVAAHDLKSPLSGISGLANQVANDFRDHIPAEAVSQLDEITSRCANLQSLLEDILEYASIESEVRAAETFEFDAVVSEIHALVDGSDQFPATMSGGTVNLPKAPLQQVLLNLIANTIKHHDKPQGAVRIGVTADEYNYFITYVDDGPGIPREHSEKVFGMFTTLKPKDEKPSSGLGLATVRRILSHYDADIKLVYLAGHPRGVNYEIRWPRHSVLTV